MSTKEEVRALTKPDPFLQRLQAFGGQVKSHQTVLLASVAGLIVIGVVVTVLTSRAEKTHEVASRAFADAQKVFEKAPTPGLAAADAPADGFKTRDEWRQAATAKFDAVAKDHPGSGAARMSHLYLAQIAMDKNDAPTAVTEYQAFMRDMKSSDPLFGAGTLGLAAAYEDAGKSEEAMAEYRKLASIGEAGKQLPLGDEALMALGRMQEKAGKAHEARDAYDRVTKEYPTSMLRYKAQARLASLPKE